MALEELKEEVSNDCKVILVATVPRTGSTAFFNVLNSLPDSKIVGENNGSLIPLVESAKRVFDAERFPQDGPWEGNTQKARDKVIESIKASILALWSYSSDVKFTGCKEIRFDSDNFASKQELSEWFACFKRLFPSTVIVVLTREPAEIAASMNSRPGWWPCIKTEQEMREQQNQLVNAAKENGAFIIDNSDWTGNPDSFTPLWELIGVEPDEAKLTAKLNFKHSH